MPAHQDPTYRLTEVVGTSRESIHQAVRNGVARAAETVRHLDWFQVTELRGSDKQGRRIDEGLKHDTGSLVQGSPVEARADERREQEGPADDEPTPDALLTGDRPAPNPNTLSHDEVEARTELARHLEGSVF